MVYCGCRTCCNKLTWCTFVLFLLGSAVLLGVGLYKCVPCTTTLVKCVGDQQIKGQEVCWQSFWKCNNNGLFFILSIVGVAAFFVALLSCCCFLCARKPSHSKRKQDEQQYIAGGPMDAPATGGHDQATYPDQYAAYNPAAPVGTKPGSHYV